MDEEVESAAFQDLKTLINKLIKELEKRGLSDSQIVEIVKNITE